MRHSVSLATMSLVAAALVGCSTPGHPGLRGSQVARRFIGVKTLSDFAVSKDIAKHKTTFTSPEIDPGFPWNELVASWNLRPADAGLKVEARGIYPDHQTRFYTLGLWTATPGSYPRQSVNGQRDADGEVKTDTLALVRPGARLQLRLTFDSRGTDAGSALKFLGLSFCDTHAPDRAFGGRRSAWGKTLAVPERCQLDYKRGRDWCSPTSVTMVLDYWARALRRPELDKDVPEVAAGVYDPQWPGTGNWPFNTAYAGGFEGLRAYVTRLRDVSELEPWIAAGVPVIVSVAPGLLHGNADAPDTGHLVVCVGFTKTGDPIMNDPWARRERGQTVRRVYRRANLAVAWKRSHRTAYLIYPIRTRIPKSRFGDWEQP